MRRLDRHQDIEALTQCRDAFEHELLGTIIETASTAAADEVAGRIDRLDDWILSTLTDAYFTGELDTGSEPPQGKLPLSGGELPL